MFIPCDKKRCFFILLQDDDVNKLKTKQKHSVFEGFWLALNFVLITVSKIGVSFDRG